MLVAHTDTKGISMYKYLLFVHVLMAVVWVGGALTLQVQAIRLQRANDPVEMARFARETEWIGMRVFMPASLLVLIVGIFMVLDAWSFEQLWILIGIGRLRLLVRQRRLFPWPSCRVRRAS